jgi:hypothetical protein
VPWGPQKGLAGNGGLPGAEGVGRGHEKPRNALGDHDGPRWSCAVAVTAGVCGGLRGAAGFPFFYDVSRYLWYRYCHSYDSRHSDSLMSPGA